MNTIEIKKIKSRYAILYNSNNCSHRNTAEVIINYVCDTYLYKKYQHKSQKISFFDCKFDYYDEEINCFTNFVIFEPKNYFKKDFYKWRSNGDMIVSENKLKNCNRTKDQKKNCIDMTYTIVRKIKFATIYNKMIKAVNKIFSIDDIVNNDYEENKQILTNHVKESGISKIILNHKRDMEFRILLKYSKIFLTNRKILLDTFNYKFWKFHEKDNSLIFGIQVNLVEKLEITVNELFDSYIDVEPINIYEDEEETDEN